ncbi:MAG: class I SAM-dependent methyltransferase [Deltaproteobacteria bacterium]|nr:class I SAM-dependent methyltransferase [Deltaproteobacteria bacterium]
MGNSPPDLQPNAYTSKALGLFLEGLKEVQESEVLDVGSVCGDNIRFFAHRVKRLYICDMFRLLRRDTRDSLSPNQALKHLDYTPRSFHGILLWNLIEHLNDSDVGRLAELCYGMLKPRGMLFASLTGRSAVGTAAYSFVVKDDYRLKIAPKPDVSLPLHVRSNREVLELFFLFTPEKSFLYQNGLREYLFRND